MKMEQKWQYYSTDPQATAVQQSTKKETHHLKCQQSDSRSLLHSKDCYKENAKNNQTPRFNIKHSRSEAQMPQTCTWDYNLGWRFGGTESRSCGSP